DNFGGGRPALLREVAPPARLGGFSWTLVRRREMILGGWLPRLPPAAVPLPGQPAGRTEAPLEGRAMFRLGWLELLRIALTLGGLVVGGVVAAVVVALTRKKGDGPPDA